MYSANDTPYRNKPDPLIDYTLRGAAEANDKERKTKAGTRISRILLITSRAFITPCGRQTKALCEHPRTLACGVLDGCAVEKDLSFLAW